MLQLSADVMLLEAGDGDNKTSRTHGHKRCQAGPPDVAGQWRAVAGEDRQLDQPGRLRGWHQSLPTPPLSPFGTDHLLIASSVTP